MFWTDQNFANTFEKAVPKEKIFKELLKNIHFVTMATRLFDGIKFCEEILKITVQGTFPPSLVQFGRAVWEEKIFKEVFDDARRMTHDGRRTPGDPGSSL